MRQIWIGGMGLAVALGLGQAGSGAAPAVPGQELQAAEPLLQMSSKDLIALVLQHETDAGKHRGYYTYLSVERSERTGGHEWTERVAETTYGKVKYLVAEDGKPLTGARLAAERARVEDEGAHPEAFRQQEAAKAEDEQHARQMMSILGRAFLFDPPELDGDGVRVRFRPNPGYQPSGLEERVLHAMTGSVLIDPKAVRTRQLEGRMPQDVSIGFGILATIHAGSNFATTRGHVEGPDWKTQTVHTAFNGKALFLKTITRQEDARHTDFKRIPDGISVADAVKLVEQQ